MTDTHTRTWVCIEHEDDEPEPYANLLAANSPQKNCQPSRVKFWRRRNTETESSSIMENGYGRSQC